MRTLHVRGSCRRHAQRIALNGAFQLGARGCSSDHAAYFIRVLRRGALNSCVYASVSIERVGRELLRATEENRFKTFVGGKVTHPSRQRRQRRRGTRVLLGQCTTRWSCFIKYDRGPCQRPSTSSANDQRGRANRPYRHVRV